MHALFVPHLQSPAVQVSADSEEHWLFAPHLQLPEVHVSVNPEHGDKLDPQVQYPELQVSASASLQSASLAQTTKMKKI